jgi:hypothetical protein
VHLPPDLNRHLPTGRLTFENALEWLIEYSAGLRVPIDQAKARLAELEAAHMLYRSWHRHQTNPSGDTCPHDALARQA